MARKRLLHRLFQTSAAPAERVSPNRIRLEASSFCQLRCPSCPTTTGAINPAVGSGFLRLDDFRQLVDLNPELRRIEISNYGEIFLNPQLVEILEYAHERGVTIAIENGANLNNCRDEALEALVKHQVEIVTCSIDGASPETYKTYRVRGDFDRVIANVEKINAYKRRYMAGLPHLVWQFVVFGHNEHELPAARAMARRLGMEFRPKLTWDSDFSPIRDAASVRAETGQAATREEFERNTGEKYASEICRQLWDDPQINWNGKVLGCCRNFWGDFGGNAFRDGLEDSLNSEKIVYAREMLTGQKEARADIPCTSCEMYVSMREQARFIDRRRAPDTPPAPPASPRIGKRVMLALLDEIDAEIARPLAPGEPPRARIERLEKILITPPFLTGSAIALGAAPLVSVVLPTLDRAAFIGEAIRSVQAQSYQNWELIIVDDGSRDGTADAVAGFLEDRRIRYIERAHGGQSAARNHALGQSRGEMIAYLDSDNLWYPRFLEAAVSALSLAEETDLVYGALTRDGHFDDAHSFLFEDFDWDRLLRANYIDLNSVIHRRSLLTAHGGFDETLTRLVDWDILLRYTRANPAMRVPVLAAQYRVLDDRRVTDTKPLEPNFEAIKRKWRR